MRTFLINKKWLHFLPSVAFLIFLLWVLPLEARRWVAEVQTPISPDTSFYYSQAQLYDMAELYGAVGRQAYIVSRMRFDILWPLVYGVFFCHILWLIPTVKRPLHYLPWCAVLLDGFENTFVSIVFARYPQKTDGIATLAGWMTAGKWLMLGGVLGVIFVSIMVWTLRLCSKSPSTIT